MKHRISRPHSAANEPAFVYRPQHTDLTRFADGYESAFGKGENRLIECPQCGTRHWTHQSCRKPEVTP